MSGDGLVTLSDIHSTYDIFKTYPSDYYHKTPLLSGAECLFKIKGNTRLYLKLENTQVTGE